MDELTHAQKVLEHEDEELSLAILVLGATDRSNRPAESVEVSARPPGAAHLLVELRSHDFDRVRRVEVREVDKGLAHVVVENDCLAVGVLLADHLAVLVLDQEHLLGLRHARDHRSAHAAQHGVVHRPPRGIRAAHAQHQRSAAGGDCGGVVVEVGCELLPVLHADLERLFVVDHRDQCQVLVRLHHQAVRLLLRLNGRQVRSKEAGEEHGQVVDEPLVCRRAPLVGSGDVCGDRDHGGDDLHEGDEELHEADVKSRVQLQRSDFSQARQRCVPEARHREKLLQEQVHHARLEDVSHRNPAEEAEKSLQ
mmetsp:Transcript_15662/g.61185  ORF Transcript_15662/g.61185 Transcript_15662/m.61185 type:complete len:309 (-) Transcript_15662:760-1686(-)